MTHATRRASNPCAALDLGDAFRDELAVEIVHGLQRLRQQIPGVAEQAPIERRAISAGNVCRRPVVIRRRANSGS